MWGIFPYSHLKRKTQIMEIQQHFVIILHSTQNNHLLLQLVQFPHSIFIRLHNSIRIFDYKIYLDVAITKLPQVNGTGYLKI